MVEQLRAIAIVLLLAALAYVLYLWTKRKDQIRCPQCDARVNIYDDECAHCGYEKGQDMEEHAVSADTAVDETVTEESTADVDYDEIVDGTISEVKDAVDDHDLDLQQLLDAEKANKDRVTLVDWLEEQLEETATA